MADDLRLATPSDHDALFAAYAHIVDAGDGFPHAPPLSREEFDEYWIAHTAAVWIALVGGALIGAYYLKPNFVGRAAHIANGGSSFSVRTGGEDWDACW